MALEDGHGTGNSVRPNSAQMIYGRAFAAENHLPEYGAGGRTRNWNRRLLK